MADWFKMGEPYPPMHTSVIGINVHPGNDDTGVINGILYDLRPNCIIDLRRGRWMECTHWAYPPDE